jgi:hypothetical protein
MKNSVGTTCASSAPLATPKANHNRTLDNNQQSTAKEETTVTSPSPAQRTDFDTVVFSGYVHVNGKQQSGFSAKNDNCTITRDDCFICVEQPSQDGHRLVQTFVHLDKVMALTRSVPAKQA